MCRSGDRQDQTESQKESLPLKKGPRTEGEEKTLAKDAEEVSSPAVSIPRGEDKPEVSTCSQGRLKILVVDDNQDIRDMLEDFLSFEGHTPVLAKEGKEALKIFSEQDFDLVITDLGMPGMSGWELSSQIKKRRPDVPIVIITGWGAQLSDEDLRKNEAQLILSKPFHLEQVQQTIEKVRGGLLKVGPADGRLNSKSPNQ